MIKSRKRLENILNAQLENLQRIPGVRGIDIAPTVTDGSGDLVIRLVVGEDGEIDPALKAAAKLFPNSVWVEVNTADELPEYRTQEESSDIVGAV